MKKYTVLLIFLSLILLLTNTSYSQMIKLGISAGLAKITGPAAYTNSIADNGNGFGSNFNFGAQARINIPLLPITPIIFVDYYMLRGSGNIGALAISTSQNILSAGIEGEFNILPLPFVTPYISVEAAVNRFGTLERNYTGSNTPQGSVTRYGGALGVGAVITILPFVDLDASLKFHLLNLIGKSSGESGVNALTLNVAVIF